MLCVTVCVCVCVRERHDRWSSAEQAAVVSVCIWKAARTQLPLHTHTHIRRSSLGLFFAGACLLAFEIIKG